MGTVPSLHSPTPDLLSSISNMARRYSTPVDMKMTISNGERSDQQYDRESGRRIRLVDRSTTPAARTAAAARRGEKAKRARSESRHYGRYIEKGSDSEKGLYTQSSSSEEESDSSSSSGESSRSYGDRNKMDHGRPDGNGRDKAHSSKVGAPMSRFDKANKLKMGSSPKSKLNWASEVQEEARPRGQEHPRSWDSSSWRDIPSKWRDIPSNWRDIPSNWRDSPSNWRDIPSKWRDIPCNWREQLCLSRGTVDRLERQFALQNLFPPALRYWDAKVEVKVNQRRGSDMQATSCAVPMETGDLSTPVLEQPDEPAEPAGQYDPFMQVLNEVEGASRL